MYDVKWFGGKRFEIGNALIQRCISNFAFMTKIIAFKLNWIQIKVSLSRVTNENLHAEPTLFFWRRKQNIQ